MKLEYSRQVIDFVAALAPEPRRAVVRGMKQLPSGKGDIKALQGELTGFWRLRVKGYRIIFRYGTNKIRFDVAEKRSIVYELLALQLHNIEEL